MVKNCIRKVHNFYNYMYMTYIYTCTSIHIKKRVHCSTLDYTNMSIVFRHILGCVIRALYMYSVM